MSLPALNPLGFSFRSSVFIPAHGPKTQDFNCGDILQVLPAPFVAHDPISISPSRLCDCLY